MDLFFVNRYLGDNGLETKEHVEEERALNNVLSKIQLRKKRKIHEDETAINTTETSNNEDIKESSSTPKKKKKNKKSQAETQVLESQDTEIEKEVKDESGKSLPEPVTEDASEVFKSPRKKKKKEKSSSKISDSIESVSCEDSKAINGEDSGVDVDINQNLSENNHTVDSSAKKDLEPSFTVIGTEFNQNKLKANRKLPSWLENPVIIPMDLEKKDNLEQCSQLDKRLVQKLKDNKVSHFFPVQEKVIPWLLKNNQRCLYHWPRDVCVSAPTGSGKTLAFVLPIVQALIGRVIPEIRAIVVLPVAELAKQVGAVFQQYCSGFGLKVTIAIGGTEFIKEHSLLVTTNELVGCLTDILVTTPGRLVAHLRAHSRNSAIGTSGSFPSGSISLTQLQFLVIDEADRVIEGSQNDWLSHLMHHLELQAGIDSTLLPPSVSVFRKFNRHPHRPPQKLLFSATLSQDPEKLCTLNLFQPKLFSTVPNKKEISSDKVEDNTISKYVKPKELSEEHIVVQGGEYEKPLVLLWLLHQRIHGGNVHKALIFSSSRQSASRLALLLSLMLSNDPSILLAHLSADLQIKDRQKIMNDFTRGSTNVLISSDALARGVDIPMVDLVVSYDPPRHLKNHIHRIGRTARAGRRGFAVTILTPQQQSAFSMMVSGDTSMGDSSEIVLSPESLISYQDKYKEALAKMQETLKDEQQKMVSASKKRKRRKMNVKK